MNKYQRMTPLYIGFWKNFLNTTCIDLESIQKGTDPEKTLHAALLDPSEAFFNSISHNISEKKTVWDFQWKQWDKLKISSMNAFKN